MSLSARFFRWHRWLAWLVALQVLLWVAGGVVFAWLPFQPWVKAADAVAKPRLSLPPGWAQGLAASPAVAALPGPVLALQGVATAGGPALKLRHAGGELWLDTAGRELPAPDAAAVERFARTLYRGSATTAATRKLDEVPSRLGLVNEMAGRRGLWQVTFDDGLRTRLYFDARSGEFLAARNEAWVLYDFFWRLHVMDYGGGEDFNNPLLRTAAPLALALVLTGGVLAVLALRRVLRKHRSRERRARAP